jgi:hypothetical protein
MSKSELYDIRVQGTPRFSVRADVARRLGLKPGHRPHLTVTENGKLRFKDWYTLRSGLEVYGPHITAAIKPRARIHVVVRTK